MKSPTAECQPPFQQQILNKICRDLAPGGYLVSGEAERELVAKQHGLQAVAPACAVFQNRRGIEEPTAQRACPLFLSLPSTPSKARLPPPHETA